MIVIKAWTSAGSMVRAVASRVIADSREMPGAQRGIDREQAAATANCAAMPEPASIEPSAYGAALVLLLRRGRLPAFLLLKSIAASTQKARSSSVATASESTASQPLPISVRPGPSRRMGPLHVQILVVTFG